MASNEKQQGTWSLRVAACRYTATIADPTTTEEARNAAYEDLVRAAAAHTHENDKAEVARFIHREHMRDTCGRGDL